MSVSILFLGSYYQNKRFRTGDEKPKGSYSRCSASRGTLEHSCNFFIDQGWSEMSSGVGGSGYD